MFKNNIVKARTINDAWRDTMWLCVVNGYDYKIEQGSYVGQIRKQLEYLTIIIEEPWQTPLAVSLPEGLGFAPPTSEEKIQNYFFNYLLSNKKEDKTSYTYGQYILKQIDPVINKLYNSNGNTNQAVISIGNERSIYLNDPPCLRTIDFKVVDGKLNMTVYFRSWDIFAGLPENLGGLQLLKEYVLNFLDDTEDGKLIAHSAGAHLYEMYFSLVNQLCVDKISVSDGK